MKKLSFYTILCCLAVVCTFSLNSCQEFNIDSQAEFPPLLETDAQSEYAVLAKSPNTIIFNISSNMLYTFSASRKCRIFRRFFISIRSKYLRLISSSSFAL